MNKRYRCWEILCGIAMGFFLLNFFINIHPLVIYDFDDWLHIAYRRNAIPSINEWNPTKVLPETLMPLVADIGANFIYPIIGDYIKSLIIIFAIVGSAIISCFFVTIYRFIKNVMGSTVPVALVICSILFLFSFSIFRNDWQKNYYMFWARDVNCFFNYVIPGLLNSTLVLELLLRYNKNENSSIIHRDGEYLPIIKDAALILLTYLAIFSNLFHSAILSTFVFTRIMIVFVIKKPSIRKLLSDNKYECGVLIMWLTTLVLEAFGRRASYSSGFGAESIAFAVKGLLECITKLNKATVVIVGIITISTCYYYLKRRDKEIIVLLIQSFISMFLLMCFLILLCAAVDQTYIYRSDAMFGMTYWVIFISGVELAYSIMNNERILYVLPLLIYILLFNTMNAGRVFRESNEMLIRHEQCIAVDNYILDEIINADRQGIKSISLHVPVGKDIVNWPHTDYMGGTLSDTLCQHGVISGMMEITIVPDEAINERFSLGY